MRPLNSGLAIAAALALLCPISFAQMRHSNAPRDLNQRVYLIAPLIGAGTLADPKRPMFIPASGIAPSFPAGPSVAAGTAQRTGIIGYHSQISDDGKSAIVELIAPSMADFKEILSTTDSRVQVFVKGVHSREVIEAAFKAQKKDFSFEKFMMLGVR